MKVKDISRERVISELLNAVENADTTYKVLSETECIPAWLRKTMRKEWIKTKKILRQAEAVGILF